MSNRRIAMYEYQVIIKRLQQGHSIRSLSRAGFAGRKKLSEIQVVAEQHNWLLPEAEIPDQAALEVIFQHKPKASSQANAEVYREKIIDWSKSGIQGSTIHQHLVDNFNYQGSYTALQKYIGRVAGKTLEERLTTPLDFKLGEAAQIDFGSGPPLYDDRVQEIVPTWFFVMTLCWSRHQYAEIITHQDVETWLKCHQNAFEWFGGVPRQLIIDNAKCAITKACYHDPAVQRSYEEFALGYGFIISACPPYDPKKKGRVESGVKYIKRGFVPLRDLTTLVKSNQVLRSWIIDTASTRTHGSTFEQPIKRFKDMEQQALMRLPQTLPEIATWQKVSLYKDCHIRYQKCKYSAPYKLYGQELWVKATVSCIFIYHDCQRIAMHSRLFKAGEFSTDQNHLLPKAQFYLKRNPSWCLNEASRIGVHCQFIVESLLTDPVRDLLRQAQSLLSLADSYDDKRLENACCRAVFFSTINYQSVKKILKEGLDHEEIKTTVTPETLNPIYQGQGHYQRSIKTIH